MNKKWLVMLLLMLSVGINIGLLAGRWTKGKAEKPVAEGPAGSPEQSVAGPDGERLPPRLQRSMRRMADELELSGEKRKAFSALQRDFFRRSMVGRQRLRTARSELRKELTAPTPDRARAEHWVREMGEAQVDLENAFVANFFQTRDLVEPGQEEKLRRLMARIHKVRRQLMERSTRPRPFRESRRPGRAPD